MRFASILAPAMCTSLAACGGSDGTTAANDGGPGDPGQREPDASQADASPPVAICDGGDELRLAALYGGGFSFSPADSTPVANGDPFVYVDGSCRYWTSGHEGQALSGTLDEEGQRRLTSQLSVASWPDYHDGDWNGDGADAPPLILWEPAGRVICTQYCEGPKLPEALVSIGPRLREENERLRAEAEPLDGPMRAMAIEAPLDRIPSQAPVFEWIYQPPIADFSYREDEGSAGVGPALIDDPAAVTALRAAWLEAQQLGEYFLPARDEDGVTYRLFARDVLPFEPEDGWGIDLTQ